MFMVEVSSKALMGRVSKSALVDEIRKNLGEAAAASVISQFKSELVELMAAQSAKPPGRQSEEDDDSALPGIIFLAIQLAKRKVLKEIGSDHALEMLATKQNKLFVS